MIKHDSDKIHCVIIMMSVLTTNIHEALTYNYLLTRPQQSLYIMNRNKTKQILPSFYESNECLETKTTKENDI